MSEEKKISKVIQKNEEEDEDQYEDEHYRYRALLRMLEEQEDIEETIKSILINNEI